jgi:hypothetical protein
MTGAANAATAKTNIKTAEIEQARAGLEMIGSLALGSMNGDINGKPDPARFEEGLEYLSAHGIDVTPFRGRADLAPLVARSSMTALQQIQTAQNQQQIDLAMEKFEFELEQGSAEGQFSTLTSEEARSLGLDPSKVYQRGADGKISEVGGSLVTVNLPDESSGANQFWDSLGTAATKRYERLIDAGDPAARNLARLSQLEELLSETPQGLDAAITSFAGNWGVDLGDASGVQAAQAMINSLVPEQRQPGSGPMSDADLELFKQSVPRLINQPGGNQLIIDTMRAINTYDMQLARIVEDYALRGQRAETPEEADALRDQMRAEIDALQNPIETFRGRMEAFREGDNASATPPSEGNTGTTSGGLTWSIVD